MYEMILKVYHTTSSVSILCAVLFQTDLTVQQLRGHPRAFVAAMTADTACTEGGGGQKDGVAWWMRKM